MLRLPRFQLGWLVCCAVLAGTLPCAAASQKMLVLKQTAQVSGDTTVYIAPSGLRIDYPGIHSVIICSAPAWRVLMYNNSSKMSFETSPEKFEGRFNRALAAVYGPVSSIKGWNKVSDYVTDGLPARHYKRVVTANETDDIDLGNPVSRAEYWGLTGTSLPKAVCNVLAKINNLPPLSVIPLKVVFWTTHGKPTAAMQTSSITTVPFNTNLFAKPAGLKLAHTQNEVFMDMSALDMMDGYKESKVFR